MGTIQVSRLAVGPNAPAANIIPTISGGSTVIITSGTTANITYTGNDSDGTIASFQTPTVVSTAAISPTIGSPSYTGIGTANATVTFPVTGLTPSDNIFTDTTTDNSGGVSTPGTTRIIYTSTSPAYRSATSASYSVVGGAANALAALNRNAPTTDYLQSPAPPAGASDTVTFQPLDSANVPVTFGVTGRASDTAITLTRTVSLMQGSTVIATRSATLATTDSTVGGTTSTGETSAITDRSSLSVNYSDA